MSSPNSYYQSFPSNNESSHLSQSYASTNEPLVTAATRVVDEELDPIKAKSDESTALVLFVLGFFVGGLIIWAIAFFMFRYSVSPRARLLAKVAGVLSLLSLIPWVSGTVFLITYLTVIFVAK